MQADVLLMSLVLPLGEGDTTAIESPLQSDLDRASLSVLCAFALAKHVLATRPLGEANNLSIRNFETPNRDLVSQVQSLSRNEEDHTRNDVDASKPEEMSGVLQKVRGVGFAHQSTSIDYPMVG